MKRFWKYLLWALIILLLVVAVVLYIVPYYLKQREIQAAQADLALLSIQSTPSPSLKNGIDALWLLEFRTKNDADRADLMKRFGNDIRYHQDVLKQNQELQGRRIAELNLYNESLECSERMAECLNAIRADLPKYKAEVEKMLHYWRIWMDLPTTISLFLENGRVTMIHLRSRLQNFHGWRHMAAKPQPLIGRRERRTKPGSASAATSKSVGTCSIMLRV